MLAELTSENCVFVSGHSYNVYRKMYSAKTWEGKGARTTASYMAYASVKKDPSVKEWPSRPQIKAGCVHILVRINSQTAPGREGYKVDWNFGEMFVISPPIYLPHGVGQGPRFANDNNPHLMQALMHLKSLTFTL